MVWENRYCIDVFRKARLGHASDKVKSTIKSKIEVDKNIQNFDMTGMLMLVFVFIYIILAWIMTN